MSVQNGRKKRPLFTIQQTFKRFINAEGQALPPLPKNKFKKKVLIALLLNIVFSSMVILGLSIKQYILCYIGMICICLITLISIFI